MMLLGGRAALALDMVQEWLCVGAVQKATVAHVSPSFTLKEDGATDNLHELNNTLGIRSAVGALCAAKPRGVRECLLNGEIRIYVVYLGDVPANGV